VFGHNQTLGSGIIVAGRDNDHVVSRRLADVVESTALRPAHGVTGLWMAMPAFKESRRAAGTRITKRGPGLPLASFLRRKSWPGLFRIHRSKCASKGSLEELRMPMRPGGRTSKIR